MLKRFAAVVLFAFLLPSLALAHGKPRCELCIGVVATETAPSDVVPLLVLAQSDSLAQFEPLLATLSADQKSVTTLSVGVPAQASVADVDATISMIVEWAKRNGPFEQFGIDMPSTNAELKAYSVKRLSVALQGQQIASRIILPVAEVEDLEQLYATGAQAYFDAFLTAETGLEVVQKWALEKDPSKRINVVVTPGSPNVLFDAAQALSRGAATAYLRTAAVQAVHEANTELRGDFAYDNSGRIEFLAPSGAAREGRALAFVRGEDLRTLVFVQGDTTQTYIVSLPADDAINPRRITAQGEKKVTDTGRKGGRFLIGVPPTAEPFVLSVDRPAYDDTKVTKETIDVATTRGISVEEIIRNHQAYENFQNSISPRYIARNETKLRFSIGAGERLESALAGDHFFDPTGTNDWIWKDLYINGVRWKYGKIPELPLIQPEKVTQLPLDIHLTNDYRYTLAGETEMNGFSTYEVRFEPPRNAAPDLPLYRGTVWIDRKTWARVRLRMLQLNLSGEVLSNEEQVDFAPFSNDRGVHLTAGEAMQRDPRTLLWLPTQVVAQQTLSTAGRTTAVERQTDFTNFRISPENYAAALADAWKSDARMVRETDKGLRYLDRRGDGERVVKEDFDTSRLFLLGGLHHDEGMEYPVVPLGGVDYFNFNFKKTGLQTNVFFAGVLLAINATDPSFLGTRTNVGVDFFGIGVATENTMFRDDVEVESEAVKSLPVLLAGRVGHPFLTFGKADFGVAVNYISYQRADTTAADFAVPSDTVQVIPGVDVSYERRGWNFAVGYEQGFRSAWEPWGNLAEYDEDQKNFSRYKATLGKSFYLPKFQRIGVEVNYLDGQNLDRFSKYEFGFFGSTRVRGIRSGSLRAERAILGHLSYGFVISDQIRLEAFYDHALVDDATAAYKNTPFQGVGIAGQLIGPYGTLMRIDVGKTIGRNAQDDFVADVMLLKIFD